jgi:hypothetical protein
VEAPAAGGRAAAALVDGCGDEADAAGMPLAPAAGVCDAGGVPGAVAQADKAAKDTRLSNGRKKGWETLDMAEASLARKRAERWAEQRSHPVRDVSFAIQPPMESARDGGFRRTDAENANNCSPWATAASARGLSRDATAARRTVPGASPVKTPSRESAEAASAPIVERGPRGEPQEQNREFHHAR